MGKIVLEGPKLFVDLAEPAAFLRVAEGAFVHKFNVGIGNVRGENRVGGGDVIRTDEPVQDAGRSQTPCAARHWTVLGWNGLAGHVPEAQ